MVIKWDLMGFNHYKWWFDGELPNLVMTNTIAMEAMAHL